MNKKILIIAGTLIVAGLSVAVWQKPSHSQESSVHAADCGVVGSADSCCITYLDGMDALHTDWSRNLRQILDQEKAASDMTDEAFEGMRTYNCWLDYLCEAVSFSGIADPRSAAGTGLTSDHIGTLPGCQDPEDMEMGSTWTAFSDAFGAAAATSKFSFIPQCKTDSDNNKNADLGEADAHYRGCKKAVTQKLAVDIIGLETAMKETNAEQKTRALENKLESITIKLQVMQEQVSYLKNKVSSLVQRYACWPARCDY